MSAASTTRRRFAAALGGGLVLPLAFPAFTAAQTAGASASYMFLVFSDPVPGQEAAYQAWFQDHSHLAHMTAIAGVTHVQRYKDAGVELRQSPVPTPQDLVVYTVTSDRPQQVAAAIAQLGQAWPSASVATVRTATYRALSAPVKGVGGEPAGAAPGPSSEYLVLAMHNLVEGQDDAFNRWYDDVHLPELMAYPGVVGGQRGVKAPIQFGGSSDYPRYIMVVAISTSDLPSVFKGMLHGGPPSPAIDRAHSYGFTYKAVSEG